MITIATKLRKKSKWEKQITLLEGMNDRIWKRSLTLGITLISTVILAIIALKIHKNISIVLFFVALFTLFYAEKLGCSLGFLFVSFLIVVNIIAVLLEGNLSFDFGGSSDEQKKKRREEAILRAIEKRREKIASLNL